MEVIELSKWMASAVSAKEATTERRARVSLLDGIVSQRVSSNKSGVVVF